MTLAALLRLAGGLDALKSMQGAGLTPAEAEKVAQRVLEKRPLHAGRFCHGPIADALERREVEATRAAEAQGQDAYLPDDPEAVEEALADAEARLARVQCAAPDPTKQAMLVRQIRALRARRVQRSLPRGPSSGTPTRAPRPEVCVPSNEELSELMADIARRLGIP